MKGKAATSTFHYLVKEELAATPVFHFLILVKETGTWIHEGL